MTLIERLLAQASKEANELADLLNEAAEALAQPKQEPAWWPAVENILDEYGLQAIDFVADFKAALALPQQEPVAEVQVKMTGGNAGIATIIREIWDPLRWPLRPGDKLYTSPPAQRKPLTDERLWKIWNSQGDDAMEQQAAITFARAIEEAHGIKDTPC